jgi:hypothetical protein
MKSTGILKVKNDVVEFSQQRRGSTPSAVFFNNWDAVCRNRPYPERVVRLSPKMKNSYVIVSPKVFQNL